MRVTFAGSLRDTYEGIESAAEKMLKYQRQVSTGVRVSQPSDDPAAAATAIGEKAAIASFEQYTQAGDSAESRLTVADTVLADVIDKLTAARTTILGVQGSNTTAAQRATGAQELASLRDFILEDLNTSFGGTFLFGGASGTVRPYPQVSGVVQAYAGSTREVSTDIDHGRAVAVTFDGSAIAQGSETDDIFTVFENAITAATAGDTAALQTASEALQRAFERSTQAQSRVGTNLRAISDHQSRLADAVRASKLRASAAEDANMVEAISGMKQSETAYQSALSAASRMTRLSLFDYLR